MPEQILPGTYITVRDDALISAGQVITGNIGAVGTASKGPINQVQILGSFSDAREMFGDADSWQGGGSANELTLIRALEQIYNNGGSTVYAVRTANKNTAIAATFQTRKGTTLLTKLTANTPGTWGNSISISITDASQNSFVTETLSGDAASLRRSHIVAKSSLNNVVVKQKSTGLTLNYTIVYDAAPDDTQRQVEINSSTGALTFTKLAGYTPVAGDSITAGYEVPQANSKNVELASANTTEIYTIADAADLADQINQKSALVSASTDPSFYNQLPDSVTVAQFFGSVAGDTPGSNGETASADDYKATLALLENEIVNIVHLCGQDATNSAMLTNLEAHINTTAGNRHERIAIIGSNGNDDLKTIAAHGIDSPRIVFVAPGIQVSAQTRLPGSYTAAAVAGLLSSLDVQASPTNKTLTIPGVSKTFSASQLENLVTSRVLAVENRDGFRVVKGITTSTNTAWTQITTRRIVDYAIYGVRSACDPYIGKLNNERVRGAMKATIDAFLTRMTDNEALVGYTLDVTATRAQQVAGQCIVTMTIQPTFSIDFVVVTMYLG